MEDFFLVAKVVNVFGIKGQLKIKILSEEFTNYNKQKVLVDKNKNPVEITYLNITTNNLAIISLKNLTTRNEAEALKNLQIFVHRKHLSPLKENEIFAKDLIGKPIFFQNKEYGKVVDIYNFGAGDIIEVIDLQGKKALVSLNQIAINKNSIELLSI